MSTRAAFLRTLFANAIQAWQYRDHNWKFEMECTSVGAAKNVQTHFYKMRKEEIEKRGGLLEKEGMAVSSLRCSFPVGSKTLTFSFHDGRVEREGKSKIDYEALTAALALNSPGRGSLLPGELSEMEKKKAIAAEYERTNKRVEDAINRAQGLKPVDMGEEIRKEKEAIEKMKASVVVKDGFKVSFDDSAPPIGNPYAEIAKKQKEGG